MVNTEKELALLEQAHDQAIWTLEWHPLGHILATGIVIIYFQPNLKNKFLFLGSNDNNTKFWARNRPGDTQEDIFGLTALTGLPTGILTSTAPFTAATAVAAAEAVTTHGDTGANDETPHASIIPGMGLDENIFEEMNRDITTIPALGVGLVESAFFDDSSKIVS